MIKAYFENQSEVDDAENSEGI